jgi:hypothetical protein
LASVDYEAPRVAAAGRETEVVGQCIERIAPGRDADDVAAGAKDRHRLHDDRRAGGATGHGKPDVRLTGRDHRLEPFPIEDVYGTDSRGSHLAFEIDNRHVGEDAGAESSNVALEVDGLTALKGRRRLRMGGQAGEDRLARSQIALEEIGRKVRFRLRVTQDLRLEGGAALANADQGDEAARSDDGQDDQREDAGC